MAIDLSTFWATWDVVGGNTQATNQYEFWNGMIMANGDVLSNQYEFFKYHNTTRYEWFKNLQGTYPEVYDEYTFYKNTTDPSIFDFSTFYQYGGAYLGTTTTTTAPPGVAWSAQQYSTSGQCSFTTANITFYTAYDPQILIGATIYSDVSCTIPYVGDPTKYYTIKLASDPSPRGYIQIDGSGVVTSSVSCYFNFDLTTGYETNDGGCSDETPSYNLFFSTDPVVVGTAVYSQGEGGQNTGRFIYGNDLWYKDINGLDVYQLSSTGEVTDIYTCTVPIDPDYAAFMSAVISAGGTTNSTISAATETLFTSLKSSGLYNDILIMYPMIGGTLPSHAINAKSPGTFNLTWYGTPSANSNGTYLNGGYGDPVLFADNGNIDVNDTSVGVYVTVACTGCGNEVEWGGTTAASSYEGGFIFPLGTNPVYKVAYSNGLGGPSWPNNNTRYGLLNKTSSTTQNIWQNGTLSSSQTVTTRAAENQKQMLGCWYIDGNTPYYQSTKTIGFFHLGKSLNNTEAQDFMSIVNTFNTTLSRNIY